ncbi:MAG: anti-sigma factor antagonist [Lachnospiraceae bacterium]|nr:anti-sigma factor antagonist [Lachnospiraceae bacterium]
METTRKTTDHILRIRVPGELDHHSAKAICREADRRIQTEDIREIIFDFADTTFCDSSGIGMLMGRYKMIRALGGKVRAVQVQAQVARILTLSGVTKIIPVEEVEGGRSK